MPRELVTTTVWCSTGSRSIRAAEPGPLPMISSVELKVRCLKLPCAFFLLPRLCAFGRLDRPRQARERPAP
eukprot:7403238-Lingulodinium_polyedra.AAC.1